MFKKLLHSRELTSIVFIIVMFLGVGAINPTFLTLQNIWLCLNSSVVYTVVAVGISLVLITGEIDVSVGATLGMAAAISGTMIRNGQPWGLAIICALLVGLLIGCVNGFGVVVLKIPSIIMTLGINGIVRGLIYVYTDGKWIENIPFDFKLLSQGRLFGTVTFFYLGALILIVLVHLFLTKSKRGRYFAAIGDNIGGATLLGIPVDATKFSAYAMCGVFAAIGGVIFVSRVGFVTPPCGKRLRNEGHCGLRAWRHQPIGRCWLGDRCWRWRGDHGIHQPRAHLHRPLL